MRKNDNNPEGFLKDFSLTIHKPNTIDSSINLIAQEFPFWTQMNADCKDFKYNELIE